MSQTVPLFLAQARAARISIAALLERYSLPADADTRREIEVPLRVMQELPDVVARAMDEPCLGLNMALTIPRGMYGLFEFRVRNASTLDDALRSLGSYARLLDDLTNTSFELQRDQGCFRCWIDGEPACFGRQANELTLGVVVRLLSEVIAPRTWTPLRVWFAHDEPSNRARLSAFFGTREIEFGAGSNGFTLSASDLQIAGTGADPALRAILEDHTELSLAVKPSAVRSKALGDRLRNQIFLALRTGAPRLHRVAAELGISSRTLQRRLADEHHKFNDLVEAVRQERARAYLTDDELVLGEIAFLLGYSDLRAFVRAFKRWTGVTPARYREKMRR